MSMYLQCTTAIYPVKQEGWNIDWGNEQHVNLLVTNVHPPPAFPPKHTNNFFQASFKYLMEVEYVGTIK